MNSSLSLSLLVQLLFIFPLSACWDCSGKQALLPVQQLQLELEPARAAAVHIPSVCELLLPVRPAAAAAACIPPALAETVVVAAAGQQLAEPLSGFFELLGSALGSDDHSWC